MTETGFRFHKSIRSSSVHTRTKGQPPSRHGSAGIGISVAAISWVSAIEGSQQADCSLPESGFDHLRRQHDGRMGWRSGILASGEWLSNGRTTKETQPAQNTFLIWRKGKPANFELKTEFKLTGFNSGIQYRSIELPDIRWAMKGYQADMDGEQVYTGQIYESAAEAFWRCARVNLYFDGPKARRRRNVGKQR